MIDCFSQKLNDTQSNYSIMKKELLAILKGLDRFRNIILGSKIIVLTDNSNILSNKLSQTPRIKRWKYLLNEYEYELKHIKGKANVKADILSRLYFSHENKLTNDKIQLLDNNLLTFI